MKNAICELNSSRSENTKIYETFVPSEIYQTKDDSFESAKKILIHRYGQEYVEKLEYITKHCAFEHYTFRNNHIDWEYSTITVRFIETETVE
jgi:prenyltransferase beta subunit